MEPTILTPRQLRVAIVDSIEASQPLFIWGPPGIGKSEIVGQASADLKRQVRDIRAGLLDPVDLRGVPYLADITQERTRRPNPKAASETDLIPTGAKVTKWAVPDFLPTSPDANDVIFLDELNVAPPLTLGSFYQLVRDYRIGEFKLSRKCAIIAAGNRDGDGGVTHRLPTPLKGRFVHVELKPSVDDWCVWAVKSGIDPSVVAYIRWKSDDLHRFDKNARACPDPRRWEFVSKIVSKPGSDQTVRLALVEGAVGMESAIRFVAFMKMYRSLPNLDNCIMNPTTAKVPNDPQVQYAIVSALAARAKPDNFGAILQYASRLPVEFQTFMVRDSANRNELLTHTPEFTQWCAANANFVL